MLAQAATSTSSASRYAHPESKTPKTTLSIKSGVTPNQQANLNRKGSTRHRADFSGSLDGNAPHRFVSQTRHPASTTMAAVQNGESAK